MAKSSPSARPTRRRSAWVRRVATSRPELARADTSRLVKPIAATAGDRRDGVRRRCDGERMAGAGHSAARPATALGRPLPPFPSGTYQVRPGQLWLLSGHDPRSFDSRYFGPVPVANVQGVARPVWVLR